MERSSSVIRATLYIVLLSFVLFFTYRYFFSVHTETKQVQKVAQKIQTEDIVIPPAGGSSPIVIFLYTDVSCPYCKVFHKILQERETKQTNTYTLVPRFVLSSADDARSEPLHTLIYCTPIQRLGDVSPFYTVEGARALYTKDNEQCVRENRSANFIKKNSDYRKASLYVTPTMIVQNTSTGKELVIKGAITSKLFDRVLEDILQ